MEVCRVTIFLLLTNKQTQKRGSIEPAIITQTAWWEGKDLCVKGGGGRGGHLSPSTS